MLAPTRVAYDPTRAAFATTRARNASPLHLITRHIKRPSQVGLMEMSLSAFPNYFKLSSISPPFVHAGQRQYFTPAAFDFTLFS